ncbi:hypothetical protein NA57DRAFT_73618 [Rhizodiscina lignyota]|uniref:Uncharacterized protein n=1 Tax=Rhizodiscina lignyota TaxID=1504668 RepID=A0A9P4IIH7_9PEZI|nr:hypothetical protein NA57DRAFT_73618 [Rhizodiscina lignyota]
MTTTNADPNLPYLSNIHGMARADSGIGDSFGGKPIAADDANDESDSPSTTTYSETTKKLITPSSSPIHRKHSVSSTGQSKGQSSGSRSSSLHSRRRGRAELRPRRMHSSPVGFIPRSNVEEAIAFHERSCRLMESLSSSSRITDPMSAALHRTTTAPYIITPPLVNPHTYGLESPLEQPSVSVEGKGDDLHLDSPPASIMHWTSNTTRRKEYAEIDKQNSGFRKFMRKLLPSCLSRASTLDFYDEKDRSDAGSVRRYRMDIPDDDK